MKSSIVNTSINYVLVLFAFLLPISTPMTNIAIIILILLWLIEGNYKKKYEVLKSSLPFKLFFAFILLIGLSLFWSSGIDEGFSNNKQNAILFYFRYYFFGFMILPVILTSMKKAFIDYIVSSFILAMLVSELMSWGIFMEWIHYKDVLPNDPSPFMHHTFYSIFLAVTIFVLIVQFFQTKTQFYRILIGLFILSAIVNLFLNGGRLGQIAFFVALFVLIGLKYKITFKSIGLFLLLSTVVFFTAYKVSPIFQKRMDLSMASLEKITEGKYNSSLGIRVNALVVAKELVKENPVLGVGIGSARTEFLEKAKKFPQTGFFPKLRHLHNGYMQILVETGFVGLALFFLYIYFLLKLDLPRDQYILMSTIIVIFLMGFVGEPLFFSRKPYLLFILFMGIFMYSAQNKKRVKTT